MLPIGIAEKAQSTAAEAAVRPRGYCADSGWHSLRCAPRYIRAGSARVLRYLSLSGDYLITRRVLWTPAIWPLRAN
ncbi:hypothetical protein GWI33_011608 [Rhynchophorus ferrugineus]|uniref:Uncharacterized protein n=1 Tax=Rhynchophorus ferrugineus TaxID=354439 RepID=A0A834M9D5_RHYFE|nr:hypothetical protein GWI33_011608 [Rhynchophorus ferrugineus]